MKRLQVGSLFSGIGGIDVGLEAAGMEVAWQVEADLFCRTVLKQYWTCPVYDDVRHIPADAAPVDVLAGGFPCQDLSQAASGWEPPGLDGARSGLWSEYANLIRRFQPRYVIVENVAILRHRGLHRVLGDLAHLGYDAEWDVFPAAAFGAPHRRARLWLVAYPNRNSQPDGTFDDETCVLPRTGPTNRGWPHPPEGVRMDDGFPRGMDRARLRALGNAVVPVTAQWVGQHVLKHWAAHT